MGRQAIATWCPARAGAHIDDTFYARRGRVLRAALSRRPPATRMRCGHAGGLRGAARWQPAVAQSERLRQRAHAAWSSLGFGLELNLEFGASCMCVFVCVCMCVCVCVCVVCV